MPANLLAALDGGRSLQHILPLHNDLRRCWAVLLTDIKKDPLQAFFPFLCRPEGFPLRRPAGG